jgi:hypothetical protein
MQLTLELSCRLNVALHARRLQSVGFALSHQGYAYDVACQWASQNSADATLSSTSVETKTHFTFCCEPCGIITEWMGRGTGEVSSWVEQHGTAATATGATAASQNITLPCCLPTLPLNAGNQAAHSSYPQHYQQPQQQEPPGLSWPQHLLQKHEGQPPFPLLQLPHHLITAVASKLHREDAWEFAEVLERTSPAAAAAVRSSIVDWKLFAGTTTASRRLDVPAYVMQLAGLQQLTAQVHIKGTEQYRTGEAQHKAYVCSSWFV